MTEERTLGRRQILRGAGVATGVAVAGLGFAAPASASDDRGASLSGSWMIVRQDDGSPDKIKAVVSFAAGSVIITHDIDPAGPPFTGTWAAGEDNQFRATFWTGQMGGGPNQPAATVVVKLRGRRSGRNKISGTYTFTATAGLGTQTGTGKFTGSPITA
jgi:hypothetical protein